MHLPPSWLSSFRHDLLHLSLLQSCLLQCDEEGMRLTSSCPWDVLCVSINHPLQLHLVWWAGHGCGQARLAGLLLAWHRLQGGGQGGLGLLALPPQDALQVFGQLDKLVSQLGYSSGHLTTPSQSYLINMTTLVMAPLSCTTLLSYLPTRLQIYLYL